MTALESSPLHDLERFLAGRRHPSEPLHVGTLLFRTSLLVGVPWSLVSLFQILIGQFDEIWLIPPRGPLPWILHGLIFAWVAFVAVVLFSDRIRRFLGGLDGDLAPPVDTILVDSAQEDLEAFRRHHLRLIFGRRYLVLFAALQLYAWILDPLFSGFSEYRYVGHTVWTATVNAIFLLAASTFIWMTFSWSLTAYRITRLPWRLDIYDRFGGLKPFVDISLRLTTLVSLAVVVSVPNALLRGDLLGFAQLIFGTLLVLMVFLVPIARLGSDMRERKRTVLDSDIMPAFRRENPGGKGEDLASMVDALVKYQLLHRITDYPVDARILSRATMIVAAPIGVNVLSTFVLGFLGL